MTTPMSASPAAVKAAIAVRFTLGSLPTVPWLRKGGACVLASRQMSDQESVHAAAAGELLPTVSALAEHYDVGRGTVSRMLRRLAHDGLLVIRERWGTFRA